MVLRGALRSAASPLVPDGDEARRWAEQELSDPAYREAEPTLFDRAARAVGEFFDRIFSSQVPMEWGGAVALVAAIVVAVVVVAAFLVWGLPRSTRRTAARSAVLFGEAETRSAAELRRDAESRARRGDWDAAIILRFRALARGVLERGVIDPPPGATVHAFARAAGAAFPAHAASLEDAAQAFDDVRYLRRPGTRELYDRVAGVDEAVARTRPAVLERIGGPA